VKYTEIDCVQKKTTTYVYILFYIPQGPDYNVSIYPKMASNITEEWAIPPIYKIDMHCGR